VREWRDRDGFRRVGHVIVPSVGGSYDSGTLTCNGTPFAGTVSGVVVNGLLNGSDVTFQLDSPNLYQGGTISGGAMSGVASWLVPVNGQAVTLTGTWTAAR